MAMDLGDAKIKVGLDTKRFESGLKGVTNKLNTFSKNMGQKMAAVGKQMSMKVTMPLVALGVGAFKMAGDFDKAMRQVNVMLKASGDEFEDYKDQVLDISSTLGKSSDEVAASFYQIVSAGYRGGDAIDILRVAMEGAVGGMADAELTTAALTKAMNIFQLKGVEGATRAMDVFFGIVDSGLLTFEEMAAAFPRAATMAAGLGVSIEETGAALATLSKVSGSTEQASTALNAVFTQLIKPSAELQALYEEWGVKTGPEAIEEFGGLAGVLDKVQEATGGNVAELSDLFPNVEAIRAILPLVTTNAEDFANALDTVTNSSGMTGDALDEMTQGPGFQWQKMMVTIKNAMIELGDVIADTLAPWIDRLIGLIQGLVDWFKKMPGPMKDIIVAFGVILAALGPILLLIGQLIKVIPAMIVLVVALASHVVTLASKMGGIITAGMAMVKFIYFSAIPALIKLAAGFIATMAAMGPVGWLMIAGVVGAAAAGIAGLTKLLGGAGAGGAGAASTAPVPTVGMIVPRGEGRQQAPPGTYWAATDGSFILRTLPNAEFGGIVPGPIGRPVPIMAHGGEQYAGVGNRMGNIFNFYNNFEGSLVSEREFVDNLRREFILEKDRNTTTGF